MNRFYITTSKGKMFFSRLPKSTYFTCGYGSDIKGGAMFMHFDNGTTLSPIISIKTRKQVQTTNKFLFGKTINEL